MSVGASAAFCLVFKAAQHRFGVDLADEGFLWYGAQRVLAGELPLRDFQAYDPGRYWWAAAWMWLVGDDGLLTLRWSSSILAAITVGMTVWLIRPAGARTVAAGLLAAGLILSLWVAVSDALAAMLLLLGLAGLIRKPSPARFFVFGLCWGVAATIGINHALYGAIAGLLAFLYLRGGPQPVRLVSSAAAGAILGYAPMLALHIFAEGFTWAFADSIMLLFEAGTTNVALPFPRPWAVLDPSPKNLLGAGLDSAMSVASLLVPVVWAYVGWRLLRGASGAPFPAVTVAGVLLSVPYAHYFLSRTDLFHFALSVLPLLVALLAWALAGPPRRAWVILAGLGVLSLAMTAPLHSAHQFLRGRLDAAVEVDGARLLATRGAAEHFLAVQRLVQAAAPHPFFAGPYLPGAYALARQRSPTWEIYMLFPATLPRQRAEVERLRALDVRYAVIGTRAADDNSRLGIQMTHPIVFAFLTACHPQLERLPALGLVLIHPVQACS